MPHLEKPPMATKNFTGVFNSELRPKTSWRDWQSPRLEGTSGTSPVIGRHTVGDLEILKRSSPDNRGASVSKHPFPTLLACADGCIEGERFFWLALISQPWTLKRKNYRFLVKLTGKFAFPNRCYRNKNMVTKS